MFKKKKIQREKLDFPRTIANSSLRTGMLWERNLAIVVLQVPIESLLCGGVWRAVTRLVFMQCGSELTKYATWLLTQASKRAS